MATLNLERALDLARQLATIPEFPRMPEAIEATAADLVRWCEDEEQAEWLVNESRETWKKWQGTSSLRDLYRSKFDNRRPPEQETYDLGQKPPILCRKCNDTGASGPKTFCDCPMGAEVKAIFGDKYFQTVESKQMPPVRTRRRITQADVDIALMEHRNRKAQDGGNESS